MTAKYRPAFTLKQLLYIAYVLEQGQDQSSESESIMKILIPLTAKISCNTISAAYKTRALEISEAEDPERYKYEHDLLSHEEQLAYEAKLLGY